MYSSHRLKKHPPQMHGANKAVKSREDGVTDFLRVTPFSFYAVSCFGICDALRICSIILRISCSSGKLTNPTAVK